MEPAIVQIAIAIPFVVVIFASLGARAAEPAWPTGRYDYVVIDQDLRAVLEQFGSNTGLRIILSDNIKGRVHGRVPPAPPQRFLDHLTEMFGLDWYFDGAVIAVSAKSEAQTQLVALKSASFSRLKDALDASGFIDERYSLRPGSEPNVAIVSGPPQYLATVKKVAAALSPEQAQKPDTPANNSVMIMRGSAAVTRAVFP
jgi:type III secretion protein C